MSEQMNQVDVTIDENIPLPVAKRARASKYPWKSLNPKQSFFVHASGTDLMKLQRGLNAACGGKTEKRYPGMKFIVRQARADKQPVTDATPADGVRCWRIE